jgi:hypothetical protein
MHRAEITTMAGSKKKKSKTQARATFKAKKPPTKMSAKAATRATKKPSPAKKTGPKKASPTKAATKKKLEAKKPQRPSPPAASRPSPRPSPKASATDVGVAGRGVWFRVADGIEHAVIRKTSGDGSIVALTDAGAEIVLPSSNLFDTATEARAYGRAW